ncbi:MAG: ribbon-helix-helix protein, CopG family [Planctomycetes bacterium]|nr:ribbon-helix-helix protein, CopG family [Planctomycetota bacterium]
MKRTNIYLSDRQLLLLGAAARSRGRSVADLVREAVEAWLVAAGAAPRDEEEWRRRFDGILERRREVSRALHLSREEVDREVAEAVREVRRARRERAARGR